MAQNQIDVVLSNAVDQIDLAQIPGMLSGQMSIPITETTIKNLLVLNTAPSGPVQDMHIQITPDGLRLDFQAYGFAYVITALPIASNGQLSVRNVAVEGIVSFIMSSDELTSTLNTYLRDARMKLGREIVGVVLKDHEIDVTLS